MTTPTKKAANMSDFGEEPRRMQIGKEEQDDDGQKWGRVSLLP